MEEREEPLPRLMPGGEEVVRLRFSQPSTERIRVDVMRPTGFSAASTTVS